MVRKTLAASIMVGAIGMGGASLSHADAVATAYLNIFNFSLTDSTGTKLAVPTDLTFEEDTIPQNDGDTNANLNGTPDDNTNQADAGLVLDVDVSCVGDCGDYANNDFTYVPDGGVAGDRPDGNLTPETYALGDVLLTGAIVDINAPLPDADAKLLAEVVLEGGPGGTGSSSGNNVGVDAAFAFESTFTGDLTVSFDAELFLRAALTADELGTVANATSTFSISIVSRDGTDDYLFNTFPLNNSVGSTSPGVDNSKYFLFSDTEAGATGSTFTADFAVRTGQLYDISISGTVQSNATLLKSVPIPGTLALFGLGLVGLGAMGRRAKS